mmetsp:Transcript_12063/g.48401  ORF Transcript_12063/g.48401 Transcript_12063/m.48401 type:complete len:216 (+) Transcript_12063:256-903(+)
MRRARGSVVRDGLRPERGYPSAGHRRFGYLDGSSSPSSLTPCSGDLVSSSLSPAASAAAFFAASMASAAALAPAAAAIFFSSSVGPEGSAGASVSILPPAATTHSRSAVLSWLSAWHCSVRRFTSVLSFSFSSVNEPTLDPSSSHSACFLRRLLRALSLLDCFLRWRFSSLSSIQTSPLEPPLPPLEPPPPGAPPPAAALAAAACSCHMAAAPLV